MQWRNLKIRASYGKEYFLLYGIRITNVNVSESLAASVCMHMHAQSPRDIMACEALSVFPNYALSHRNHLKLFFQHVTALFGL